MKFTNQELFWKGKQGDNYINRNAIGYRAFNIGRNLLRNKIDIKSAAEIGPNIGHNLNAVKNIYPNIETFGIEINKKAYKELRKKGEDIKSAILRTGAQRLRPVLLTTLTTFFGLVPMAIGLNINFIELQLNFNSPSSQWWLQLSNAIVFGVMFSFVLTLVVTPCLIMIGETSKFFRSF